MPSAIQDRVVSKFAGIRGVIMRKKYISLVLGAALLAGTPLVAQATIVDSNSFLMAR